MASRTVSSERLLRRVVTPRGVTLAVVLAMLVLVLVAVIALCLGTEIISPSDALRALGAKSGDAYHITANQTILLELRLPRILLAISVGAALSACGVLFQALLRNPLAEPYILGISNGCAVGAILGFMINIGPFGVSALSFAGGAVVVAVVLAIGRGSFGVRSESMLLGGVMVGAIGAAMIFVMLSFLGDQLRSAIQWTLGDLSSATASIGYGSTLLFGVLALAAFFVGDRLNTLALGDEEAASLGMNVNRSKTVSYLIGSFIVGMAVSFCGAIGFVGLVVPHILRRIVGNDHRILMPLSVIAGGIFLLCCDTLARTAIPLVDNSAGELPVGAVTALLGAPVFIYLLRRR